MASGQTLATWTADGGASFPATNYATFDTRNTHPCYDFDPTTQETIYLHFILPRHYGGNGITVYLTWGASSATSGTGAWDIAFERIGDGQQDLDSDGFATAQAIAPATVPGTSGNTKITNVAVSNGANMDSVAVGELFRLRIRRDVANDDATGDLELCAVELKET